MSSKGLKRDQADAITEGMDTPTRADYAEGILRRIAAECGIPLELRTWSGPWD